MPRLTRHYSVNDTVAEPETAQVESVEDLYLVPWLNRWHRHSGFYHFALRSKGAEHELMVVLERGKYNMIAGHLDAPLLGLPLWRARPWWTLIVPGQLPTKVLNLRSKEVDFRQCGEAFDLRPLVHLHPCTWDSVARGAEYGYVSLLATATADEMDFRAVVNDDTYASELDRSTGFLRHLIDRHWQSLTWAAYSWDEDAGRTTPSISGDGRQLAQQLPF